MPVLGSVDDHHTAAKLKIGGKNYYGKNSHGMQAAVKDSLHVNAQTVTHAEGQAFYNAYKDNVSDKCATLIVDRPPCRACG